MDNVLKALDALKVSELDRSEWLAVGMALKEEGLPVSVWDAWSRDDRRYHAGECERLWEGFRGAAKPVTGATIVQMAKDRGWRPCSSDGCLDWDDGIGVDADDWDGVRDLTSYLETLFEPSDVVGYVTGDVWQNEDGRYVPAKGVYDRTAGELLKSLKKHPRDIGATIGDWKPEAGAWIRYNPLDGEGVKNDNVTAFRYALVESDTLPIPEQEAVYKRYELPIAALVHSGGKSLHAIVKVDAKDAEEYRKRVDFLYDFLEKNGVAIDKQNRNPSRLSRLPGVTRNGNRQRLVAVNVGRKSWVDWLDFVEGEEDELPPFQTLGEIAKDPPPVPEPLIEGILRRGHKMLISSAPKAGKSFLLMELGICIAEGIPWLGFQCHKGRVLYVNMEIDPATADARFLDIYREMGIDNRHMDDIVVWNLRGCALPLDKLAPKIIRRVRDMHLDAIMIDPIYKVITGDENNASEMGSFCNQFDKICNETGCACIYVHHHSKGAQGGKKAMDRASGSGVFARDPDAQLDVTELVLPDYIKNNHMDGRAKAYRMESSLREFENIKPVNFWWKHPLHYVDDKGVLAGLGVEGTPEGNFAKAGKYSTPEARAESVEAAYAACSIEKPVTLLAMAKYADVTERAMRERIRQTKGFRVEKGFVFADDGDEFDPEF